MSSVVNLQSRTKEELTLQSILQVYPNVMGSSKTEAIDFSLSVDGDNYVWFVTCLLVVKLAPLEIV